MKLQLRHPSILSDQLVATDICHVSHREDKLWCVMNPEWQLESSTLWKQRGSRNKNNPLSISEVWWMNTTVNLIKLLSYGFCQAAYQIILIFPNLKKQMLCPDGNTSGKKKKINHFPVVNFDFYENHIFHLEGRISKQLLTMANKQVHNHQELLVSKWKEISCSKQTPWVCNLLQFHYRYHDN